MLLFTVIHVNFSQSVYSAEEADGNMTITLQADGISILPYSIEINPMEFMPVGAPGMYVYRVLFDCMEISIHNLGNAEGNGIDFESDTLTAVFSPGAFQANVSMPVMMDQIFEPFETLQFSLTVPDEFSNANGSLLVFPGPNNIAEGEIIDSNGT